MDAIGNSIEGLNFFTKKWGWEFWFANTEKYCGKQIFIKYGIWSSEGNFHYHRDKDETFLVLCGTLILDFCEYADEFDQIQSVSLNAGQSIRFKPWIRHRFTSASKDGCTFIEASTHHEESDSYRCRWDLQEKKWVDYDPQTLTKGKK